MHRKTQGIPLVKKNHFFKIICHITSDGENPPKIWQHRNWLAAQIRGRKLAGCQNGNETGTGRRAEPLPEHGTATPATGKDKAPGKDFG